MNLWYQINILWWYIRY